MVLTSTRESRTTINVLLVEDDKIDRMAFERMVLKEKLPYQVDVACSSDEARGFLSERKYDIILVDYLLGDGTGLDLLEDTGNVPVIVVTGAGSEEIAVQAMRMGAYDYLIKDHEGKFLTVLPVTIASVLDRRNAEQALQESEERYRGMAEFADSVIHNVGNVISSIQTSCEVIQVKLGRSKLVQVKKAVPMVDQGFRDELEQEKKEQLPRYLNSAVEVLEKEQMDTLREVSEMLTKVGLVKDIIKSQQDRRSSLLRIETFSVHDLVEDTLRVMKPIIREHGVQLAMNLDTDAFVKTDRSTLIHVLINIVKNAAEAMDRVEGERLIVISAGVLDNDLAHLSVRDTGVGISVENLERLFSHGFTTKHKGHGFGLHYCAHVMKEMGGTIDVSSAGEDKGTNVRLTIPIVAVRGASPS